ncbi:MAG: GspE/PulE/PilB domain-containing protein, partial [Candidatus Xenobia bacterium]
MRRDLRTLLIEEKLLAPDQLTFAEQTARRKAENLGNPEVSDLLLEDVIEELGYLTQAPIAAARARDMGIPFVELAGRPVDPALLKMIPVEMAMGYRVIAVAVTDDSLTLGMDNPDNDAAAQAVEQATGRKVRRVLCTRKAIGWHLMRLPINLATFETLRAAVPVPPADKMAELMTQLALEGTLRLLGPAPEIAADGFMFSLHTNAMGGDSGYRIWSEGDHFRYRTVVRQREPKGGSGILDAPEVHALIADLEKLDIWTLGATGDRRATTTCQPGHSIDVRYRGRRHFVCYSGCPSDRHEAVHDCLGRTPMEQAIQRHYDALNPSVTPVLVLCRRCQWPYTLEDRFCPECREPLQRLDWRQGRESFCNACGSPLSHWAGCNDCSNAPQRVDGFVGRLFARVDKMANWLDRL